jgi:aspartyl-tRNA(Asn)/glutamyl-tRNA(Gln) amidotransferase subunit C
LKLEGKDSMEIDTETVLRIARLSRIKITDSESADIQKDLNRIVEFVKKLSEIDVDGIGQFNFGKTTIENMREDRVTIYDNTKDILKNTKSKNQDFFTVPKIVE